MNPNQIESAKENIGFLTRTMLAYMAGGYLLAGAVGNSLADWLELGAYDIVSLVAFAALAVLSAEVARLQFKIRGIIKQIGETP